MPRVSDPDYVSGKQPPYKIHPPIVHPAFCVCKRCDRLPADERTREHVVRIYRSSPNPRSRVLSAGYAMDVKRQLERELVAARDEALRLGRAGGGVTLGVLTDAYREHQRKEGKRLDRNEYVIRTLESHFGRDIDPTKITKADHKIMVDDFSKTRSPDTVGRHTRILLAILNSAVRDGLIAAHQLRGVRRPIVKRTKKPVAFTRRQVAVLAGEAMKRYEQEQRETMNAHDAGSGRVPPSVVPLRGFCLIAYRTLMRPDNNFGLEWSQLTINGKKRSGSFRLDEHKNVSRGVEVEGPLHRELVTYLLSIRPSGKARGLVHPNPVTGKPYRNIRRQWERLVEIANEILRKEGADELAGDREHFYTWRHTGASRLAESGADPVMIMRMMGDVDLETVRAHYFDSSLDHMQKMISKWR